MYFFSLLLNSVLRSIFFIIILICFVFNPFCKCMCQRFISPYFFVMLQGKEEQSQSLQVILNYLIFVTTTLELEMFLKFTIFYLLYNFLFTLESLRKIHEKCCTIRVHPQGSFRESEIFLTVSSRKHIFMHFTHIHHCYYDELF